MEKKGTIVHFLCIATLISFAVILFMIANGSISMDRLQNEDGSFDFGGLLPLMIGFNLCVMGFGGLITVLRQGEFFDWVKSCGVILLFAVVGFMFDITTVTELVITGVYAIWWLIAGVRGIIENWGEKGFVLGRIMAICRITIAIALIAYAPVWIFVPSSHLPVDNINIVIGICNWAGALSLLAAVGLGVESFIWLKYGDN